MSDILDRLDELKPLDDFYLALAVAYPQIAAELRAARAVCEAACRCRISEKTPDAQRVLIGAISEWHRVRAKQ